MIETTANCPACETSGLSVEVNEAAGDASLLVIVAGCPVCGWMGDSAIYVSEMDVRNSGQSS